MLVLHSWLVNPTSLYLIPSFLPLFFQVHLSPAGASLFSTYWILISFKVIENLQNNLGWNVLLLFGAVEHRVINSVVLVCLFCILGKQGLWIPWWTEICFHLENASVCVWSTGPEGQEGGAAEQWPFPHGGAQAWAGREGKVTETPEKLKLSLLKAVIGVGRPGLQCGPCAGSCQLSQPPEEGIHSGDSDVMRTKLFFSTVGIGFKHSS